MPGTLPASVGFEPPVAYGSLVVVPLEVEMLGARERDDELRHDEPINSPDGEHRRHVKAGARAVEGEQPKEVEVLACGPRGPQRLWLSTHWCTGARLVHWCIGALVVHWCIGALVHRCIGSALVHWRIGALGHWGICAQAVTI